MGALVAVNAVGDVRDPETGRLIAGTRDAPDGRRLIDTAAALAAGAPPPRFRPVNTTIGVVATTAALDKGDATRLARMGMEGFARALSPPHLATDGDALFALSVGDARADLPALGARRRGSRRARHRPRRDDGAGPARPPLRSRPLRRPVGPGGSGAG